MICGFKNSLTDPTLQLSSNNLSLLIAFITPRDGIPTQEAIIRIFGVIVLPLFTQLSADHVFLVLKLGQGIASLNAGVGVEVKEERFMASDALMAVLLGAVVSWLADRSVYVDWVEGVNKC